MATKQEARRVEGHASSCRCSTCEVLRSPARPTVPPTDDAGRWESDRDQAYRDLTEATHYLREIHWWVRLIGFIIVVPVILAVLCVGFVAFASLLTATMQ